MTGFNGFPGEGMTFYSNLTECNTRLRFNKHKQEYEQAVKKPCIDFVNTVGE